MGERDRIWPRRDNIGVGKRFQFTSEKHINEQVQRSRFSFHAGKVPAQNEDGHEGAVHSA